MRAAVAHIALLPEAQDETTARGYQLTLVLSDGLNSTYHKVIPFYQEMTGKVEVITADKRIIDRILERILNILKNN